MIDWRSRIRASMDVLGIDWERIGQVKQVREDDFLVNRPLARDVYVPYSAVAETQEVVILLLHASEVDDQDWPAPEIFPTDQEIKL